jgi:hypothetical protein
METKPVLLVITVQADEADELERKLNMGGYETIQIDSMESMLSAAGLIPADVEKVDLKQYDIWADRVESILAAPGKTTVERNQIQLLGYIALALTSLAKTHARSLPPVV